jgi:hypothetical protein
VPKRLAALALLSLMAACGTTDDEVTMRANPANRKPGYFDVKGYLDAQVARLNQLQPAVEKQVQLRNGRQETTRVTKTDWAKELQIFYQADINKPALRGLYAADAAPKLQNGVVRETYALQPGNDAPVKRLTVEAAQESGVTQQLTATVQQDNPLFYSEKKLLLAVRNGQLTEYEVRGVQKLVFFDTVRYSVRTRVVQ